MIFYMFKEKNIPIDIHKPRQFEALYRAYSKSVYRLCYHYTKDTEASKEMVQDIFKSLWERRKELIIEGSPENYLMRAAKLKVFQFVRDESTHARHLACALEEHCDQINCTENQILYNSLSEAVSKLIDQLPCRCKEVYRLSRENGMSNKQIASALLISEKAVEKHLTKALGFLRQNLQEYQIRG